MEPGLSCKWSDYGLL